MVADDGCRMVADGCRAVALIVAGWLPWLPGDGCRMVAGSSGNHPIPGIIAVADDGLGGDQFEAIF